MGYNAVKAMVTRREILKLALAGAFVPPMTGAEAVTSVKDRLPQSLPAGVAAIIANTLSLNPASLNTDWFGTMLMYGLLQWESRGFPEVRAFAQAWLDYHRKSPEVSKYDGPVSRRFKAGGIEITSYCGQFGLAFPCYWMARLFHDATARSVCTDIADFILHQSARNRLGMVAHDDNAEFAIPDTCYFAAGPLILAAMLSQEHGEVYRRQAILQLRTYTDVFLVKEIGLARTVLLKDGLGKTYWTRASGWLLWAMVTVLDNLPRGDPNTEQILKDLRLLAGGIKRVQDPGGGFHVLLDDPATPLETTGSAMFAAGLHWAIRKGWLADSFGSTVARAWSFVKGNITDDGNDVHVYTGWALPAEKRMMLMDRVKMGWIPGFILLAANELTIDESPRKRA